MRVVIELTRRLVQDLVTPITLTILILLRRPSERLNRKISTSYSLIKKPNIRVCLSDLVKSVYLKGSQKMS
jgi:hypothetical protein